MNKQQLIETLSLAPHIEGGYFRRTYQSDLTGNVSFDTKPRHFLTSIFYMLTDDSPIGYLHKNQSDIIHYYHGGSPLTYWIIHPDGNLQKQRLGSQLDQGQQLQLLVPGGCWKATELESGEFGLISEAVTPGFEYGDMELADEYLIKTQFPQLLDKLAKFIRATTG